MGKRIITASRPSRTSLFSLYGKAITLLFALFCVATGQTIKTAPGNGAIDGAVKSRALFASDSTPFGNIKLYLGNVAMPVYGMSSVPHISKIDSTYSDKDGYFEFTGTHPGSYHVVAEKVTTPSNSAPRIYMSTRAYNPAAADTLITVYMTPLFFNGVNNQSAAGATAQPLHRVMGKTVIVRIPEWGSDTKNASVVNIKGETIARLSAAASEDIRWNTGSVAKGLYFVTIRNGQNRLALKITVQ